ncbi:MAG: phage protein [Rhodospirillales bacterium]
MGSPAIIGAAFGLQALSRLAGGQSAQRAAGFNASVAENDAAHHDRLAEDARARGRVEEQRQRQQSGQLKARQAAALAANGLDLSSGSPLRVLGDSAALGEVDALQIRANAEREAFSRQVRATDFRNEAILSRQRGRSARTQGFLGAGGSLLTGVSRLV